MPAAGVETLLDRASPDSTNAPLLEVENLHVRFETSRGIVRAVDGISYTVRAGETVAIVGESGCGKSVSSLAIMRLLPKKTGRITAGRVLFEGRNLLDLSDDDMREVRGRDIAMIFQEPMTSLNPVLTIGQQIMEPLFIHLKMSEGEARARALELLRLVGITDGERRLEQYPHHLSGGMRQRVMIAIGLCLQSQAPHRRRADHRARRHHPGADPGADEGSVAPAPHRAHHHHAQSRRGRPLRRPRQRHVCGAHRRAGQRRRHLPAPLPSLHDRPDALGAAARPAARPSASKPSRGCRRTCARRRPAAGSRRAVRSASTSAARTRRCARSAAGHHSACWRAEEIAAGTLEPAPLPPKPTLHATTSGTEVPLLAVEGLHKYFDDQGGRRRFPLVEDGDREGGRGRLVHDRGGRDARARGRIGLRQDHGRPHHPQARGGDQRRDRVRRRRHHPPARPQRCATCGARSR